MCNLCQTRPFSDMHLSCRTHIWRDISNRPGDYGTTATECRTSHPSRDAIHGRRINHCLHVATSYGKRERHSAWRVPGTCIGECPYLESFSALRWAWRWTLRAFQSSSQWDEYAQVSPCASCDFASANVAKILPVLSVDRTPTKSTYWHRAPGTQACKLSRRYRHDRWGC